MRHEDTAQNDTHSRIIAAGFAVLARDKSAGLGAIAQAAGVGRATLHRHFPGREALIDALSLAALDALNAAVLDATKDALSALDALERICDVAIAHADQQQFLMHNAPSGPVADRLAQDRREMLELIEAARREGAFDPAHSALWIAETYDALIYAAWTMIRAGEWTPKQASAQAWTTFMTGMKGDPS